MLWSVDHPSNPSLIRCPASARGPPDPPPRALHPSPGRIDVDGTAPLSCSSPLATNLLGYWRSHARMCPCPAPSPRPRPSAGRPGTQPPFPAFNRQIMPRRSDLPTPHRHPRFTSSPAIANGRTVPIDWALPPRVRAPYHGPAYRL